MRLELIRKAVYFDEDYVGSWIGDNAGRRIADYLNKKYNFSILNAEDLRKWMLIALQEYFAAESVVVFARDVAPSSVFDDESPNCVLRRYLDSGGRIMWLGDIPLWKKGQPKRKAEEKWELAPYLSILGIQPLVSWCYNMVTITDYGQSHGLIHAWYGNRPSLICVKHQIVRTPKAKNPMPNAATRVKILAYSKAVFVKHLLKKEGRMARWLRGSTISIPVVGFGLSLKERGSLYEWDKEFANAWKVTFNDKYPNQGFIRIWDKVIHTYDLSDEILDELHSVATWKLQNQEKKR